MKGFIIYSTQTTIENKTYIQLFGRLENNQSFVTLNKFNPYFFIKEKDKDKIKKYLKKFKAENTSLKTFDNEKVIKISSQNHADLQKLYKEIHKKVECYEADLKPWQQFLIEKNILANIKIESEKYETSEKIDRVYKEPALKPLKEKYTPKLKIVSIDTEWDKKADKLLCIGVYSEKESKTFMVTSNNSLKNVIPCKNEEECLEKFKAEIIKQDPDIITGWNVIDFDFVYLKKLFNKHKISFDLGRTNENARLRIETNFFRSSTMDIPGRQVLDGLNIFRDPIIQNSPVMRNINFESLALEDVAQAILNKGKILKGKSRHDEIEHLYGQNQQKLAEYNLLDCQLVYEILEKTKIIDLSIKRSQLTGLSLDRIGGSIASFDSLYIRTAHSKGLVSPTSVYQRKTERIKGGYVHSLKPGIYKNVLVFDFKSLYPSIIRTFNIDPASYTERKTPNSIESPNKAYFKNTEGVLPQILETLHTARENAKKEKNFLESYAIKIIMNSFFGVLASPNCRYFNLKIANAITHFGQMIIKLTAEEIEKKFKFPVIYSDTDSVFVNTNLEKNKANILGKEIQEHINKFYKEYVKKKYNRQSFLELEFEKQYLSLMIPKLRGNEAAAKKRYAGLIEKDGKEKLEIIGLEAIRGDWTEVAKEFQVQLLNRLFHDEPVKKFIKDYIKKIREGKLDEKLIYKKSIRKSLKEYTKTTPPHVKAARKLPKLTSNVIEYYITTAGPEPVQKLRHKIDYEHYINKQIAPIAQQILTLFNIEFKDLLQNSKQTTLF